MYQHYFINILVGIPFIHAIPPSVLQFLLIKFNDSFFSRIGLYHLIKAGEFHTTSCMCLGFQYTNYKSRQQDREVHIILFLKSGNYHLSLRLQE